MLDVDFGIDWRMLGRQSGSVLVLVVIWQVPINSRLDLLFFLLPDHHVQRCDARLPQAFTGFICELVVVFLSLVLLEKHRFRLPFLLMSQRPSCDIALK